MKTALLKVLIVVTSHAQLGSTGRPTGYWLSEAVHPYRQLVAAGYEVDFLSPQGGKAPVDPASASAEADRRLLDDAALASKLAHTLAPDQVNAADYAAVVYAGGHGTMWDFPQDAALARLAADVYERGGVVAAVCHGPAALLEIRLSDGRRLIDGRDVTGFTNEEEAAAGLSGVVPFALETELVARGARFHKAANWSENVVVSGRLVTGQNPASASAVGAAVARLLDARRASTRAEALENQIAEAL